MGLGRRVPKALAWGRAREVVAPLLLGVSEGTPPEKNDFEGLSRCILKPSEDNLTAFSPAKILIFLGPISFLRKKFSVKAVVFG